MQLEMWYGKNLPSVRTCNGHEWAVVRVCADGKRAKFHIGDFETESEAERWISTKAKYWPSKPDAPRVQQPCRW